MNKYITALLVVLATTGVEAQTCQSVLKAALGDVSIENLYRYQAFKELEDNITNILKSLNKEKEDNKIEPTHAKYFICQVDSLFFKTKQCLYLPKFQKNKVILPDPSIHSSIFIRGPNGQ